MTTTTTTDILVNLARHIDLTATAITTTRRWEQARIRHIRHMAWLITEALPNAIDTLNATRGQHDGYPTTASGRVTDGRGTGRTITVDGDHIPVTSVEATVINRIDHPPVDIAGCIRELIEYLTTALNLIALAITPTEYRDSHLEGAETALSVVVRALDAHRGRSTHETCTGTGHGNACNNPPRILGRRDNGDVYRGERCTNCERIVAMARDATRKRDERRTA